MRLKCVQMVGNCLRGTERGELRADDFEALTGAVCFVASKKGRGGGSFGGCLVTLDG